MAMSSGPSDDASNVSETAQAPRHRFMTPLSAVSSPIRTLSSAVTGTPQRKTALLVACCTSFLVFVLITLQILANATFRVLQDKGMIANLHNVISNIGRGGLCIPASVSVSNGTDF